MAQQFNLTAQINLQSPKNVGKVVSDIQRQLKGSGLNTVNIKVKADPRTMAQTNKQLQNVSKNSKAAARDIGTLNRNLQEATRRFSVITIATGTLLSFVTGFKNATKAAVEFERELIKISQVTGKSVSQLGDLTKEVTRLSTSLGASSSELLGVSRTLAQAGFSAEQTRKALDILAKTSLGATFTSIQDTTEGAIALLRQFSKEARRAGGDIKFLEQSLDAINAVSKRFAVESDDLITVIRRVGGVFSTAGGEVNELIALFTSVRSTTRESAETIATGLRTIFTRIQRPETINQLKELGIQLQDAQGNFVGAFEAVKRLSQGLSTLDPRSAVFSQIVEDLGGFRQIGKVIPLIQQFATAQQALAVAQAGSGSTAKDAATAQQGLGVQIQKVKEEFAALIRQFADSSTFKSVAKGALEIASAMIKVAEAVEPLLPLLTSMFALKLGRSLAPGLASMAGIARGGGGRGGAGFSRFARGGMVPGQGNRDTVPAMLTPGEFVIKKSSVKKLGQDTLAQMNNNRFNVGGAALRQEFAKSRPGLSTKTLGGEGVPGSIRLIDDVAGRALDAELGTYGGAFLRPIARNQRLQGYVDKKAIGAGIRNDPDFKKVLSFGAKVKGGAGKIKTALEAQLKSIEGDSQTPQAGFVLRAGSLEKSKAEGLEDIILEGVEKTVLKGANSISSTLTNRMAGASAGEVAGILKSANIDNVTGNIFEAILTSLGKKNPAGDRDSSADWDYLSGLGSKLSAFFGLKDVAKRPTDAKSSFTSPNLKSFVKKTKNLETKKSIAEANKALDPILRTIATEISGMSAADSRSIVSGPGSSTVATRGANQQIRKMAGLNKGGGISGSDTVPALLTPGEFVFNKSSAQSIGYGNLKRMNEQGVQGYAAGGVVTTGRGFYGNGPLTGGISAGIKGTDSVSTKMLKLAVTLDKVGMSSDKINKILPLFAKNLKDGDTNAGALEKAMQDLGFKVKNVTKDKEKEAQEIKESNAARDKEQAAINRSSATRGQRVGGALQGGAQTARGIASGAQSAAGSAQSLLFLGAMIGSVTSQMSGLSDATKTAVNQTTMMVSIIGGITGTLVDVAASFVLMGAAAADRIGGLLLETGASLLSTGADTSEAAASATVTAALGPLAIAAAALAIPIVATVAALGVLAISLYYTSSRAKAEADAFAKAAGKFRQVFEETGNGIEALASAVKQQSEKIRESEVAFQKILSLIPGLATLTGQGDVGAQLAGAMGAVQGAEAGFAGGFAASGGFANPLAPIVGLVTGGVGAIMGSFSATSDYFENSAKREAELRDELTNKLKSQLEAESASIQNLNNFNTALGDIDKIDTLDPTARVQQRLDVEAGFAGGGKVTTASAVQNVIDARKAAVRSAGGADKERLRGLSVQDLTATDLSDFETVDPIIISRLESSLKQLATEQESAAKRTAATFTTLGEARQQVDATNFGSVEELEAADFKSLTKENQNYLKAVKANQQAILQESAIRAGLLTFQAIELDDKAARLEGIKGKEEEAKAAREAADATREKAAKEKADTEAFLKNQRASENAALKQQQDRIKAEKDAAVAAEALRKSLFEAAEALTAFEARTQGFIDDRLGIEDQAGIAQGRGSKLTATGLQGVTATSDLDQFRADATGAISGISDPQQRQQAKRAVDQQVAAGKALQAFADPKAGLLGTRNEELFKAGENENIDEIEKILLKKFTDAGIALPDLSFLGPEIRKQVLIDIGKAAGQVGGISQQELDGILKPIQESAKANKEVTDEIVKGNQEYLNAFTSYLNEVKRQYEEEVKFRDAVFQQQEQAIDREIRARNIINKSLGRDAAVQDRNAKEARRVQKAQADLTAAGVGVGAGDIAGLTGERQRLAGLAQAQGDEIRGTTDDKLRTQRAKEQSETLRQLAAVNKELARLADQSGRVDDMFAEMERNAEAIEKERAKREAVTAVVEEFVVGGQDTRKALVEAATGVRKAFASGTLQNQTEEQRAATVGFLDKLGDVELLGGFTGREIKQELVFRDAIKMGLDPRIAEQLATATTKEQKLIDSNELLAFEINKLSAEMRAAQQGLNPANVAPVLVEPQANARGGLIYRANGGSIFQPKGTDTVPAMLTPGEFVIRKSAVDAIGTDTLAAINSGASYFDNGGFVYNKRGVRRKAPQTPAGKSAAAAAGFTFDEDPTGGFAGSRVVQASPISPERLEKAKREQDALRKSQEAEKKRLAGATIFPNKFEGLDKDEIAQRSMEESMAFGQGYRPSSHNISRVDSPTTTIPQQFLANKKKEREQARQAIFDKSEVSSSAFMELTRAMTKQNTDTLNAKDYENIRKNFSSLSNEEFDKEYKSLQKIMRQRLEKQGMEKEFSGSAGSGLEDFPLDGFQKMEQEAKEEFEANAGKREALKMIGGVISKAGSIAGVVGSKIAEARKEQMEQAKQRARDRRFGDRSGRGTAASRKAARLSGIKSGLSGTTDQQANQARYDRILRTQGPAAAQRFAKSQNFTPAGGMGAGTGSGITQAFRNRPNMMGSPQAMQQFQQFQQYQQFLKFQQQQQFRGGVRFRAAGGGISGSDTVPAMLTPGEFVMSAGAVRQHGVGTMRALNRGQVKGFNRGGLVGGTQYLQNGGQAAGGIDLSQISQTFDKITASITKLSTNLESLNERFGFFEMQHTVTVDGQINLPGIDSGAIAQQITDSIGGKIADEVKKALDNPEARP